MNSKTSFTLPPFSGNKAFSQNLIGEGKEEEGSNLQLYVNAAGYGGFFVYKILASKADLFFIYLMKILFILVGGTVTLGKFTT